MRLRKGLQGLLRQEEAVTLGAFLKRPELRQIEAVQTPPPFDRQIETTSGLFFISRPEFLPPQQPEAKYRRVSETAIEVGSRSER
jgi:hypothetical protein